MKIKVGDTIYCMCEVDCGLFGTISKISGSIIYFEDETYEELSTAEQYYVLEDVYHSPLLKALRELK
jgi:hypothetical protein